MVKKFDVRNMQNNSMNSNLSFIGCLIISIYFLKEVFMNVNRIELGYFGFFDDNL